MCRSRLNTISSSLSSGIIIFSILYYTSLVYGKPQYIVNRIDIEHPLLFDIETGTPYKNCGGSNSILKRVELTPCDELTQGHCVLRRGSDATCNLSFESEENSVTLTARVFGIIGFVPVPLPCPQPNACENSGIECPMVKGNVYNYSITAPILDTYPRKKLWIKGELKDDNGNLVTCIELPIIIE